MCLHFGNVLVQLLLGEVLDVTIRIREGGAHEITHEGIQIFLRLALHLVEELLCAATGQPMCALLVRSAARIEFTPDANHDFRSELKRLLDVANSQQRLCPALCEAGIVEILEIRVLNVQLFLPPSAIQRPREEAKWGGCLSGGGAGCLHDGGG
eukprot:Mycagemm_TRINITY_DN10337_c1_g2::TRINITY_DN10337_c1_g2_i2::g.1075::m.1075 type:complete len:154 gc:universal TRINITY_DN10337_c1_g2_i2:493-32(-)